MHTEERVSTVSVLVSLVEAKLVAIAADVWPLTAR